MDDMILAGALSIIALYTGTVILVVAGIFTLDRIFRAVITGDPAGAAVILAVVILIAAIYTLTGLWLQKSGRI
jgi:hypothetical protein